MDYDFSTVMNRRTCGSIKWDLMKLSSYESPEDSIAVSTADMDLKIAPEITSALEEACERPIFGYTWGTPDYYDSVMSWMERRHSWKIEKEWIACAPGVVSSLHQLIYALTAPGDGVVVQKPVYRPFFSSVEQTGRTLIDSPLLNENGYYRMNFEDLEKKAALPEAKMMILCSPHNPVSRVWKPEELERLADICTKNDVILVSDEIHFDIVFPPHKHTVYGTLSEKLRKNCVICTAPSKTFNICGLQVSNIIISDPAKKKAFSDAYLRCGIHGLNSFAFVACEAAYNHGEAWLDALLVHLAENDAFIRKRINERFPKISIAPLEGTYLQWLDFSKTGLDHPEREKFLREKAGVYFESGHVFGEQGNQFERFNIAYPRSVIEEVLKRLERVLD